MLPVGTNIEVTKLPKSTLTLIAVNCAFFVLEVYTPRGDMRGVLDTFAYSPNNLNPISLVTSLFLHVNFFHLFGNMLYLWIFGGPVEERIGPTLFLYYYFGAGLWSTALWGLLESIAHPLKPGIAIGASGAISGIMALFLYRCYYGKLKMTLPILPTFIFAPWARFSIPAAPLLVYWFLRDVMGGVSSSFGRGSGIAYWGHVGGFLFGIAVGRIKRYGHEGQIEQAKVKLLKKIEEGYGWKDNKAEAELLKLLELSPRDPEVHHQLARYYFETGKIPASSEHYQQTVILMFSADPVGAAYAVLENFDSHKKPMAVHFHVKAAETLEEKRYIDDAFRVLAPIMDGLDGSLGERAYLLYIKVCRSLDRSEEADEAYRQFVDQYPKSRLSGELKKVIALAPDKVFPALPPVPHFVAERERETEAVGQNRFLYVLQEINHFITDPLFLFLWIFMLSWVGGDSWRIVVFTFFFSLMIVAYFRVDWSYHWSMYHRRSEEDARQEVNISMNYDRAVLAERGENYQKAVSFYERVLSDDPKNIQARFKIAGIYQNKLDDLGSALVHYRKLAEHAPPGHPYHADAKDILKNPRQKGRQSEI